MKLIVENLKDYGYEFQTIQLIEIYSAIDLAILKAVKFIMEKYSTEEYSPHPK